MHSDLYCKKEELYIGCDDIAINLNGYTISGYSNTENYSGIVIPSFNNILIKGQGNITYFGVDIFTTGSENTIIESVDLENNQIGVLSSGSKNIKIVENKIIEKFLGSQVNPLLYQ
ncbi:MAG: hypothetical protein ACPKQO_09295 [Nitrososphaeraceae archaeon]